MADGFYVDLAALQAAAEGVTDTLNAMATKKVSDIDGPKSAFGHDRLGGTVDDFCERWQIGVEHLAKDGQGIAEYLTRAVYAYSHVDREMGGAMGGNVVQSPTGPDPAAE